MNGCIECLDEKESKPRQESEIETDSAEESATFTKEYVHSISCINFDSHVLLKRIVV